MKGIPRNYCMYCMNLVFAGKGINYTYTQSVGGTTNGVITTLAGLSLVPNIINGVITLITSYGFSSVADSSPVGVISESTIGGTQCCRYHAKNLYAVG